MTLEPGSGKEKIQIREKNTGFATLNLITFIILMLAVVLRIHDIFVCIRIRILDPRIHSSDLDPAIFDIDLQDATKNNLKKVFLLITF